jgi:hypothetical protein
MVYIVGYLLFKFLYIYTPTNKYKVISFYLFKFNLKQCC